MKKQTVLFIALSAISATASADSYQPSHSCSKPYKPYDPNKREFEDFLEEAGRYKECIEDFVEEQKEAASNHQDAAEEAIDEWNSFYRYELQ